MSHDLASSGADQYNALSGALTDRYRIERTLGEGGMATVYLAHDLKHDRKVALKVLKPELGAVLGADRFLSEIKVTARLQHPNLLPLFDSGDANGLLYYVMPFVEGETLRQRLDREKQLSVNAAVGIAIGVSYALGYAHERGIVHRDLKPENILFQAGQPVVADFGIALAVSRAASIRATQTGIALGTPQYMSPEQALGDRAIDARSDLYSLASLLFEMLAGEPPHTAPSAQAVIMKIITDPARPIQDVRKNVPPNVAAAIAKALEKLPADRFETAREFAEALANPAFTTSSAAASTGRANGRGAAPWMLMVTSGIAIAALAVAAWAWRRTPPASETTHARFTLDIADSQAALPSNSVGRSLAVSPDGSEIVFMGRNPSGARVLFRRRLDDLSMAEVPGSVGATAALYAPTGELAFQTADRSLATLPRDGRAGTKIVGDVNGVSWGDGNVIVFRRDNSLWRTNAVGSPVEQLTRPDSASGETHTQPFVLPGGKAVLFASFRNARNSDDGEICVVRIADGRVTRLDLKGSDPRYVATGHILFVRNDGTLLAAPFDLVTLEVRAPAVRVFQGLAVAITGVTHFDVSRNGVFAYADRSEMQRPVVVDRAGNEHDVGFTDGVYIHPRLSPNADRVAVGRLDGTQSDIWIVTRSTGQAARLTRDGRNGNPEWSPDGTRVGWIHADSVGTSIRWQRADGSESPETIPTNGQVALSFVFTPDGKSVVAVVGVPFHHNIVLFPIDGKSTSRTLASGGDELQPSVSPDGRWLAFTSSETGRTEVFVSAIEGLSTRVQITTAGGLEPVWRDDHSLVQRNRASFSSIALGFNPRIEVTRHDPMFADPYGRGMPDRAFDLNPKTGELVTLAATRSKRDRIVVITGWLDELKERFARGAKP